MVSAPIFASALRHRSEHTSAKPTLGSPNKLLMLQVLRRLVLLVPWASVVDRLPILVHEQSHTAKQLHQGQQSSVLGGEVGTEDTRDLYAFRENEQHQWFPIRTWKTMNGHMNLEEEKSHTNRWKTDVVNGNQLWQPFILLVSVTNKTK